MKLKNRQLFSLMSLFFAANLAVLFLFMNCSGSVKTLANHKGASADEASTVASVPNAELDKILSDLVLKKVTIIDDHIMDPFGWTKQGNCNAKWDAGETVEFVFDVKNMGVAPIGPFSLEIRTDTPTEDLVFPEGIAVGGWSLLDPGKNWIQSITIPRPVPFPQSTPGSIVFGAYDSKYGNGLLGVEAKPTAHGIYTLILVANLLDANGTAVRSIMFPFKISIGTSPNKDDCDTTSNMVVWP